MTEQITTQVLIKMGDETVSFDYPKLYTLPEFLDKYGEDNLTIMLQDREKAMYQGKAIEYLNAMKAEADRVANTQIALNDWKPCDDRPPTELEVLAQSILNMPLRAQKAIDRHIRNGIMAAQAEKAKEDAETAAQAVEDISKKYASDEPVGEPVTTLQTEPDLETFEDQGKANDAAVQAAQEGQEAALAENAEDYKADAAFPQHEDAAAGQVEVGMPPQSG